MTEETAIRIAEAIEKSVRGLEIIGVLIFFAIGIAIIISALKR